MYTNGGTLAEVLGLFAGYEFGVLAHGARPSDDSPALTIKWLDEQIGINTQRPDDRHDFALKKYKSESNVLGAMDNFAETLHST